MPVADVDQARTLLCYRIASTMPTVGACPVDCI